MTDESSADGGAGTGDRNDPKKRLLRGVAVQTTTVAAAVHLLWAWPRLGSPPDARPYFFLAGSALAVAVAVATFRAGEYRRLYALGAGTLGAFLGGFIAWHGADAPAALAAEPLAVAAAVVEVVGIGAFLALYRLAPPTSVAVERRREGGSGREERGEDDGGEEPS